MNVIDDMNAILEKMFMRFGFQRYNHPIIYGGSKNLRTFNPSCKLIGLIVMTFAIAFVHNPVLNMIIFALSAVLIIQAIVSSGGKLNTYFVPMIPILILAVGMFFTGYRFTTTGSSVVNLHAMHIQQMMNATDSSEEAGKIWNGLTFSSRVLVYSGIGLLFALTTDRIRMIRSFQRQLHVPQVFAYGILAAWGLLPKMVTEYRRTKLAFQARGVRVSPVSPALLTTLMVKSTRWSEALACAMESRGFSPDGKRSSYEPEKVRARDIVFLAVSCGVFPVLAFLFFR